MAKLITATNITRNVEWFGWAASRWRWHRTHIDIGPVSIYKLKAPHFWRFVSLLIWPMRAWYRWRRTPGWQKRLQDELDEGGEEKVNG